MKEEEKKKYAEPHSQCRSFNMPDAVLAHKMKKEICKQDSKPKAQANNRYTTREWRARRHERASLFFPVQMLLPRVISSTTGQTPLGPLLRLLLRATLFHCHCLVLPCPTVVAERPENRAPPPGVSQTPAQDDRWCRHRYQC